MNCRPNRADSMKIIIYLSILAVIGCLGIFGSATDQQAYTGDIHPELTGTIPEDPFSGYTVLSTEDSPEKPGDTRVYGHSASDSDPVHVGSLTDRRAQLEFPANGVVSGDYAYLTSQDENALEIVNISNPAHPTHTGSIVNGTGGALLQYPSGVCISGKYAYIASSLSNAFEIVDISDQANPKHAGVLTNGTGGALLGGPNGVYVSGNYAYVASSQSHALEIVNISNPENPVHAGSIINGTDGAVLVGTR